VATRSALFVAIAALPAFACSLLVDLDGLQSDAAGGSSIDGALADGANGDASNGADGATLGDVATLPDTGNLLTNPSFEQGTVGCGGTWSGGYGASYSLFPLGHTGSVSCLMCPLSSGESSYALQTTNAVSLAAGSYLATAWFHVPVDAGSASAAGVLPFESLSDGGTIYYQGTEATPDTVWVESTESFTLTDNTMISVQAHVFKPDNGCVLVDDISLVPQ
jgi:hypothetical protein